MWIALRRCFSQLTEPGLCTNAGFRHLADHEEAKVYRNRCAASCFCCELRGYINEKCNASNTK